MIFIALLLNTYNKNADWGPHCFSPLILLLSNSETFVSMVITPLVITATSFQVFSMTTPLSSATNVTSTSPPPQWLRDHL